MAHEIYLKKNDGDLSRKDFLEIFSGRDRCCVEEDDLVIYENPDTGVGFYFEYIHEEGKGSDNVRPDGVYRVAVCVEYCQPSAFFIEALYEIRGFVENEGFSVYDPQIGGRSGGGAFDDNKLYESWEVCNLQAVREYMISLGTDMQNVPLFPYETLKGMWRWNYGICDLRERLDERMQIPTIQCVEFEEEDFTAVIWEDGGAIAIPYVDVVIFRRAASDGKQQDYDLCAVNYEDVKPLIDKYSKESFANAFLLDYAEVPEEIGAFINALDKGVEFMLMDMCDALEYEVVEEALLAGLDYKEQEENGKEEG